MALAIALHIVGFRLTQHSRQIALERAAPDRLVVRGRMEIKVEAEKTLSASQAPGWVRVFVHSG